MAEEAAKKVEVEVAKEPEAAPAAAEAAKEDVAEEKAVIPASEPPAAEEKPVVEEKPADDSKALAIVESEYSASFFSLSVLEGLRWNYGKVVVVYWSVLRVLGIGRNFPPPYAWLSSLYFLVAVQWRY